MDPLSDHLHRVVKMVMDSGEAASLAEANRLLATYQLMIEVGTNVATSPTLQAALLTAVNTGRRCFLGGVQVAGDLDVKLRVPWRGCHTLGEAILDLQGKIVDDPLPEIPRVVIGDLGRVHNVGEFAVRTTFHGWVGGVLPLEDTRCLPEQCEFTPSGVLAGALAVSEAFQFIRGHRLAGRRDAGLSLWQLEGEGSWLEAEVGPPLELLPARLWLIGLGHLGQAYLWTLGLLPYAYPHEVQLVLQDYDTLVPANDSTSLLTTMSVVDEKKTRAMARWCDERGFRTTICERRFANNFMVSDDEPQVALCGVDNKLARAALEEVGFRRIVEAGLGRGPQEYLAFQVHSFPANRTARARWGGNEEMLIPNGLIDQPAYRAMIAEGYEQCGLTQLAGRAVGAPFVGATTAAIVIAELLRMVMGEHCYEIIDGSLYSLPHRQAFINDSLLDPFNPGYTRTIK